MDEREFAVALARQAGEIMLKYFNSDELDTQLKEDVTPLTKADLEINQLVIDRVKEQYPDDDVLAEEGSSISGATRVWVCDPIDGTVPFAHGLPMSTFSLALVVDGVPQLGVIHSPFTEELFVAEVGKGATNNGNPISVSEKDDLTAECVALESWKFGAFALEGLFDKLVAEKVHVIKLASACREGTYVASGGLAGAYFGGKTAWDMAALKVIVEEAGGKVTDLAGNDQRYDQEINGAILSNGKVHEKLVEFCRGRF